MAESYSSSGDTLIRKVHVDGPSCHEHRGEKSSRIEAQRRTNFIILPMARYAPHRANVLEADPSTHRDNWQAVE